MNTITIISAKKITTKNGHSAVIINNEYTVSTSSDGRYFVANNVAKGKPTEDQDCTLFIAAFNKLFADADASRLKAIEDAKNAEEKRIADLRERVLKCETPQELAEEFSLGITELGRTWSSITSVGLLASDAKEYEIICMAADLHDCQGVWGESKRRDGHSWSEFSAGYYDLSGYQKAVADHFGGDKYFYKSQETEAQDMLERIKECDDLSEVAAIMKECDELEAGYYDCNGNLEISDDTLASPDFTGYYQDVYSYCLCYRVGRMSSWKEEENEEDSE